MASPTVTAKSLNDVMYSVEPPKMLLMETGRPYFMPTHLYEEFLTEDASYEKLQHNAATTLKLMVI